MGNKKNKAAEPASADRSAIEKPVEAAAEKVEQPVEKTEKSEKSEKAKSPEMRKEPKKRGKSVKRKGLPFLIVSSATAFVMMTALIVASCVAFYFEAEVNTVMAPPIVDKAAVSVAATEGQKLSAQIVQEGAVLLRNENGVLPLDKSESGKVNVFGWHSIDWLYSPGGDGVSSVGGLPEDDDFSKNIDFLEALDLYDIDYNTELSAMYKRYFPPFELARGLKSGKMTEAQRLVEPSISDKKYYSDALLNNAKNFSNTAFVVISRLCGEGAGCQENNQPKTNPNGKTDDSSRHFLEISTEEQELLAYVGANYEKVIVLLNTSNQFELGFLETIPGLDACFNVGYTGTRGVKSLPGVLYGDVSPSGKLADTFAYDLKDSPSVIFGAKQYTDDGKFHLDKAEGIYIGYKWYETADAMGLWSAENGYEKGYDGVVQYPFGYGLSYTTFDWTVDDVKIDGESATADSRLKKDSKIEFTVTVTNTGDYPGQDVIEIYGTAPYTPGGIEKSFVELMNYGKTPVIAPKGSIQITVTADMYDIASYDCYDRNGDGVKGWQLDEGTYSFKLQTDSHTIKTVSYKDAEVTGKFDYVLDETQYIDKDPVTGQTVKNLFTGEDAADVVPVDGKTDTFDPEIPWLTRASFLTPAQMREANVRRNIDPVLANANIKSMDPWREWDEADTDFYGNPVNKEKPVWGASGNKMLAVNGVLTDLGKKLGENFDDPEWKDVLDQVTFDEALDVIGRYYGSDPIDSVGKPRISDLDGPIQIKGYNASTPRGTAYPTPTVLGQTFNQELAYMFGQSFGNEMKAVGVYGLWGFACDLHISPFFGRNNESPSEDPFLAGTTIALATKGVNTRGRNTYTKHFATYQSSVSHTYMTEQAFRETNLKAFRKIFVDGGSLGVMTSYQSAGAQQSNHSAALITGVLRGEWKFKGSITTDASAGRDEYIEGLVRVGGNYGMNIELGVMGISYSQDKTSARMQNRMREAVHEILYTWLRTDYNERTYVPEANESYFSSASINSWSWWKPLIVTINIVVDCALAFMVTWAVTGYIKNKNGANLLQSDEKEAE